MRGAGTSFEPHDYFKNADLDKDRWEHLLNRIAERRVQSVLDVGCGTGAFLSFLGERRPGVRREGIELDRTRARDAQLRSPDMQIHTGDALTALSGLKGPFDLITLWDVFEHVPSPAQLLAAMARVLSPSGCIFIQTIHEDSLVPIAGRAIHRFSVGLITYPVRRTHEPHHLVFFTRNGLKVLANAAGLCIIDTWFDRLARGRMDASPVLASVTALLLRVENMLGNGLFVNLLLEPKVDVRSRGEGSN